MSKKAILFFMGVVLFSFHSAHAEVVINEVQILPTGEKFLELRNTGSSSVDMTGWSIKKKTASGTESFLLVPGRLEGKSVPPGGYFLIANEGGYAGSGIPDAVWPPSNTGVAANNTIIVYDGSNALVDKLGWGEALDCSKLCPANPEGGQSLQRTNSGSWIINMPTPKKANAISSSSNNSNQDEEDEEDESANDNSNTQAPKKKTEIKTPTTATTKIRAEITAKTLGYVGIPVSFQGEAFGTDGGRLFRGKYFWNFGDGDFREANVTSNEKFTHIYFFPGEYDVLLEYYPNSITDTPDAVDKVTITVIAPEVLISSVGGGTDFFVELANNTGYEIDISNWVLASSLRSFIFPKNTIIGPEKKMIVSSNLTHFSLIDKDSLKLVTPQGKIVFQYGTLVLPSAPVKPSVSKSPQAAKTASSIIKNETDEFPEELPRMPVKDLEASVISSDASSGLGPTAMFVILLAMSAGVVLYVRRQKTGESVKSVGDDFKILDE